MTISLFVACYNDTLFPETGKAVVTVLERLGHTVEFRAAQTCCGQMHNNSGYPAEATNLMRRFVEVFRDAEILCAPSSSCVATMRDCYPKLAALSGDAKLQRAVTELLPRIYEFSELLVDKLGVTELGSFFPHTVTWHPSCHSLRSLHVGDKPLRLLRQVRGLEFRELAEAEQCCGFGGTFAVKNAEVSAAMMDEKIECVRATGAAVCTALDNSCLLQIGGGLSRQRANIRCLHLAEILACTEPEERL